MAASLISTTTPMRYVIPIGPLAVTVHHLDVPLPDGRGIEEHGPRLELRPRENEPERVGYQRLAIQLGRPVLRIDMFELAEAGPGRSRAHYHIVGDSNEPPRLWEPALTEDPDSWLRSQLGDIRNFLDRCGLRALASSIRQDDVTRGLPAVIAAVAASLDCERP